MDPPDKEMNTVYKGVNALAEGVTGGFKGVDTLDKGMNAVRGEVNTPAEGVTKCFRGANVVF